MGSPSKEFLLYRREVDAVYPEPLSRLTRLVDPHPSLPPSLSSSSSSSCSSSPSSAYKRAVKKSMNRHAGGGRRFRTTPVTFLEIKEVDEEAVDDDPSTTPVSTSCKSEHDIRRQFESFMEKRRKMRRRNNNNNNNNTSSSSGSGFDCREGALESPQEEEDASSEEGGTVDTFDLRPGRTRPMLI